MLPAGKRGNRITIQVATVGQPTSSGEPVSTWATYLERWSEREDLTGSELFRAQQLAAHVTTRFRILRPAGQPITVREGLRIIDEDRIYDIRHVSRIGLRGKQGLEILAEARAE